MNTENTERTRYTVSREIAENTALIEKQDRLITRRTRDLESLRWDLDVQGRAPESDERDEKILDLEKKVAAKTAGVLEAERMKAGLQAIVRDLTEEHTRLVEEWEDERARRSNLKKNVLEQFVDDTITSYLAGDLEDDHGTLPVDKRIGIVLRGNENLEVRSTYLTMHGEEEKEHTLTIDVYLKDWFIEDRESYEEMQKRGSTWGRKASEVSAWSLSSGTPQTALLYSTMLRLAALIAQVADNSLPKFEEEK